MRTRLSRGAFFSSGKENRFLRITRFLANNSGRWCRQGVQVGKLRCLRYDQARSNDQGSLPCSTLLQSRAGTSPGSLHMRRLPPGPGVGVRTEDEIDTGAGPLECAVARSRPRTRFDLPRLLPGCAHVEQIHEKSLVRVSGRLVKTPCWDCPKLAFKTRIPPIRTVISGAVSVSNCARSTSSSSAGTAYLVLR